MANSTTVPLSELLKSRNSQDGGEEPKKKSREDWRKAKELEEARKAGTAPAAVDEEGKDINPHIPQYISSVPWYFGTSGPTLKHQRQQEEKQKVYSKLDEWYKRGVDTTNVAKRFRPGSCDNCGAMTHQKKDCMERPRKIGAKFTGVQFGADEQEQPNLSLDFDGKRDRWAGYDPSMHQSIVEEYQRVEDAKRKMRAEKLEKGEGQEEEEAEDDEDEDKYVDDFDMPGTKVDSKQRITVRNLRIREDTAKYLRNLDPESAYYDPKTRSMRDNPNPKADPNETDYAGENFVRYSGDTRKHAQAQLFAWEAYDKGVDVHVLAEPTKLEMLQKVYDTKKEEYKSNVQETVLHKYGGEEHLKAPPKALLLAQTEEYVEYSRYGKVIKGEEKPIVRSRYEEDVHPGNHTSVFGSYWHAGQWGYKCCHSYIKSSYCVGESGKSIEAVPAPAEVTHGVPSSSITATTTRAASPEPEVKTTPANSDDDSSSDSVPESDLIDKKMAAKIKKKLKQKRLKRKLKKELKKQRKAEKGKKEETYEEQLKKALEKEEEVKRLRIEDDRKRSYNSMFDVQAPTEAEMEAYQMKRANFEDPMASFL